MGRIRCRSPGCTVHCVPALHFSSRGIFDRNATLWCGYVIESQERTIYFAGDTAFGHHFAQIREKFGSPRLALLPIGAYEPRWFMSPVHMGPDEAVRAHQILAARTSIAIHHGTFQLADEGLDTPGAAPQGVLPDGSFLVLKNGQFADIRMIIEKHTLALISIIGSSLDVLGALYLAYDLLGGEHGPLRTLTRGDYLRGAVRSRLRPGALGPYSAWRRRGDNRRHARLGICTRFPASDPSRDSGMTRR